MNVLEGHITDQILRQQIQNHAKDFKSSWVKLGQALYTVYNDKIYKLWGYEKFEYYVEKEIGVKKQVAMRLLKTYYFLEQEEPAYLKSDYVETSDALMVPSCETINVLRLAKRKKELPKDEYEKLKTKVFEEGKDAPAIRKDLTALMKQRKELDPDEERENRSVLSVRRFLNAFRSFRKDMEVLKLLPSEMIEELEIFMRKLEVEVK
ncbi:MAG TPA: hypothetical protein VJA17_00425 [Candidatus Omnitrophota bacterium]|nr:hypothetical protein [Candidatus Omnitrophota bacterium]